MKTSVNGRNVYKRTGRYDRPANNIRNISYGRAGYRGQYGAGRYGSFQNGRGLSRGYGYSSYNNTSVAHDYSYRSYEQAYRKKAVSRRRREKESIQLSLPKTYATIAIIFIFTLSLLCTYASNSSRREQIASMKAQLESIQEDNEYLRTSIDDNLDLKTLEQEAIKLGMQKPAEYQLMKIKVPKESYTVQYDTNSRTEEQSFLEYIKSWFKD